MLNRKSIYALNKKDCDAIVYTDANGNTVRLTRNEFSSDEEFEKWKRWSDDNFHEEEIDEHFYQNHTLRLNAFSESYISSAGEEKKETQFSYDMLLKFKTSLTDIQFRRLWMYAVEKRTEQEIARAENVSQQSIAECLQAAKKKFTVN